MADAILIDEMYDGVYIKLKLWKWILEAKEFKLSKIKIEYLERKFNIVMDKADMEARLDTQIIFNRDRFKYFGSII